jgi:hypothetical protein
MIDQRILAQPTIHVDIPVTLKQANVVFNLSHVDFVEDVPAGIKYLHLLAARFKDTGNKGQIIGVLHGAAAYLLLNDKAYRAYRLVETGNPYKNLLTSLME